MKKTLTLAIAILLVCGSAAMAGTFKQSVMLTQPGTEAGGGNDTNPKEFGGIAKIGSSPSFRGGSEFVAVRMWANVKDGAGYTVEIVCDSGTLSLGKLSMLLGSDALKISDPPVGVRTIQTVNIRNSRGAVVLSGSFPRLSTTY